MAYGMLIDLKKCVGCHGCAVACKAANGTPPSVLRAKVIRTTEGKYPNSKRVITPMLCMQCEEPACYAVCPTGATQIAENGIITIDKNVCIGCQTCMTACPYSSRSLTLLTDGYYGSEFNEYEAVAYTKMKDKTADKCDFCYSLANGEETPAPVCCAACMAGAREFGELEHIKQLAKEKNAVQLLPESGTSPSVYYVPSHIA